MSKLDGKVALITGAGSGMGRAAALLFGKEGAKLAVADYVPDGGKETARLIMEAGGEAVFIEADVSKAADVERMVKTTVDSYGRIDILYNNAGIQGRGYRTARVTEEEWDSILNTNLKGVFLGSKYAIPVMLNQGGGVIINTASASSLVGLPGAVAYSASKGGVLLATKTMALEYARQNIRVNCICPGVIHTAMAEPTLAAIKVDLLPQGRIGQAEEVARVALFLASDDSSYVTGQSIVVDGGWLAGPTLLMDTKVPWQ